MDLLIVTPIKRRFQLGGILRAKRIFSLSCLAERH